MRRCGTLPRVDRWAGGKATSEGTPITLCWTWAGGNAFTARRDPTILLWQVNVGGPTGAARLEALACGGDAGRLCDLFGLSIKAAQRYTTLVEHADLARPRRIVPAAQCDGDR